MASQESIKELGTNGGGFYNANSAHPFESSNGFTNAFEIFLLLVIPFALAFTFGRLAKDKRQGCAVFAAMFILWIAAAGIAIGFETAGNPKLNDVGVTQQVDEPATGRQLRRQGDPLRTGGLRAVREHRRQARRPARSTRRTTASRRPAAASCSST